MIRRIIAATIGLLIILTAVISSVMWFEFRIEVSENECCVLVRKTGDPLPAGQTVATKPGQQGIQPEVLGPGRYFRNPYTWKWEIMPLTVVPSGNPKTWEWTHTLGKKQEGLLRAGSYKFDGDFPQIGVVTRKIGTKNPDENAVVVKRDSGHIGILEEVLTPGTYKLNPHIYDVELHPAVYIPAGFVGVVTNQFGVQPTSTRPSSAADPERSMTPLAETGQRGILRDVLQPGVYFINPILQNVTPVEIGFNEYSQLKISDSKNMRISFPSDTGYLIRVGVTLVWGIDPSHASQVMNEFGNTDAVLTNVIGPQLRSICRNMGSKFSARDFIQGAKREEFQTQMTEELQRICSDKNIEVLLALVREIEVLPPSGQDSTDAITEDLKKTIQDSYVAVEETLTNKKQAAANQAAADLEIEFKKIDIERETIKAETRVKVAVIQAEAEKESAEIDAQASLEVAAIQQEVAKLDAQRIEILGQANADVEKMTKTAEADGYRMLVEAFGSPQAYNLYTFADRFEPESIRLFFAGEGTFWTDLSRFEEAGAAEMLKSKATDASRNKK